LAAFHEVGEHLFKALEVGDLGFHVVQLAGRQPLHVMATCRARFGKREKRAHGLQRESQIASAADEAQVLEVILAVMTVTAHRARGCRQQANALVIADGLDVAAGALGQRADAEARGVLGGRRGHRIFSLNL
jgi:hypothetical protein